MAQHNSQPQPQPLSGLASVESLVAGGQTGRYQGIELIKGSTCGVTFNAFAPPLA